MAVFIALLFISAIIWIMDYKSPAKVRARTEQARLRGYQYAKEEIAKDASDKTISRLWDESCLAFDSNPEADAFDMGIRDYLREHEHYRARKGVQK